MGIECIQKTLGTLYNTCKTVNCSSEFKALVVSDIHLGIGDDADDFRGNDIDFLRIVGDFFKQDYTLIILGDYMDLWENKDPSKIVRAHQAVWELVEKFGASNHQIIQLSGNHDSSLLPDAVRLLFPSRKEIFMTHGHRGDWACDRESWLAKAFVRYLWAGIGQRMFKMRDPTSARAEENPEKHAEIRQAYNEWANDMKITMLWGHSHFAEQVGFAFNSGCWIGQHRDGYTIENEQLTYHSF
jgi:predicted phosphodiesterase